MAKTQWGNWTLNLANACLEYRGPGRPMEPYQVHADEMNTSAKILDWLFQVNEKTWATPADCGDLLQAVSDIFGRHVAGGGIDHPIDAKAVLSLNHGITFL